MQSTVMVDCSLTRKRYTKMTAGLNRRNYQLGIRYLLVSDTD